MAAPAEPPCPSDGATRPPPGNYRATVLAEALSRPRLLADLTEVIAGEGIGIVAAEVEPPQEHRVRHTYTVELPDPQALAALMRAMRRCPASTTSTAPGSPSQAPGTDHTDRERPGASVVPPIRHPMGGRTRRTSGSVRLGRHCGEHRPAATGRGETHVTAQPRRATIEVTAPAKAAGPDSDRATKGSDDLHLFFHFEPPPAPPRRAFGPTP